MNAKFLYLCSIFHPLRNVLQTTQSAEITLPTTGVEHSSYLTDHNNTAKSFKKRIEREYSIQKKLQGRFKKSKLQSPNLEFV